MQLELFAADGRKCPVLGIHDWAATGGRARGGSLHPVRRGVEVVAERPGRIGRIFSKAADDQLTFAPPGSFTGAARYTRRFDPLPTGLPSGPLMVMRSMNTARRLESLAGQSSPRSASNPSASTLPAPRRGRRDRTGSGFRCFARPAFRRSDRRAARRRALDSARLPRLGWPLGWRLGWPRVPRDWRPGWPRAPRDWRPGWPRDWRRPRGWPRRPGWRPDSRRPGCSAPPGLRPARSSAALAPRSERARSAHSSWWPPRRLPAARPGTIVDSSLLHPRWLQRCYERAPSARSAPPPGAASARHSPHACALAHPALSATRPTSAAHAQPALCAPGPSSSPSSCAMCPGPIPRRHPAGCALGRFPAALADRDVPLSRPQRIPSTAHPSPARIPLGAIAFAERNVPFSSASASSLARSPSSKPPPGRPTEQPSWLWDQRILGAAANAAPRSRAERNHPLSRDTRHRGTSQPPTRNPPRDAAPGTLRQEMESRILRYPALKFDIRITNTDSSTPWISIVNAPPM